MFVLYDYGLSIYARRSEKLSHAGTLRVYTVMYLHGAIPVGKCGSCKQKKEFPPPCSSILCAQGAL